MSSLTDQHVVGLLLYLLENNEANTADLKDISSYYQAVVSRAEELENEGLIEIEQQSKPFIKKTFKLTDKGLKIAEKLREAEKMMRAGKSVNSD